jgi:hypothetical protein
VTLRDLDARVVPRVAAGLRALLDGVADSRAAVSRRVAGTVLLAVVLLSGTGVALSARDDPAPREQQPVAAGSVTLGLALGPPAGADAEAHLAQAGARLAELAGRSPAARHLALVSLRSTLTTAQTGALLDSAGVSLERAYLLADVLGRPEEIVFQTPGDVVTGLQQVYAATATRKADQERDLLATAATVVGGTEQEAELRALYEQDAATAGAEAAAYGAGCACVQALVVAGDLASLAGLLDLDAVRGVEAAPRGAVVAALSIRPLRPSETGTVEQEPS